MFGNFSYNLFNFIVTIAYSQIHPKRFTESVTDSKYALKVLVILLFSETILSFSINVILEPPCKYLFENCSFKSSKMVWLLF